jgi:hypothetical protein
LRAGRDEAHFLLPRQRLLPDRLVSHVELAGIPLDPLPRGMMRRVRRARGVYRKNGLSGAIALASLMNSSALSVMSSVKW